MRGKCVETKLKEVLKCSISVADIFSEISNPVLLMEVDGNSFRYIYINSAAKKVLKLNDDIQGKRIEDVVPSSTARYLTSKFNETVKNRRNVIFEETINSKDGERMLETTLNPIISDNGECRYVLAIVRDLTERKRLNKLIGKVKQKYNRLNSLIQNSNDGIFKLDLHGQYKSVNNKMVEITGYDSNELVGHPFIKFIDEHCVAETNILLNQLLSGESVSFQTWIKHKNGKKVLLNVKNINLVEEEGIYGIGKDITQEYDMNKKLIESKEQLQAFLNYTVDPIFILKEGKIVKVNSAFEKTFGFSEEEVLKGNVIVPTFLTEEVAAINRKIMNGESLTSIETKRVTKSGDLLDFLVSYIPIKDENGKVTEVTVFYKNITHKQKTERKLQQSEEKFKIISENSIDIIRLFDSSGLVEYISPSVIDITGYPPSEFIGEPFTKFVHLEDAIKLENEFEYFMKGLDVSQMELRLKHKSGYWIWLESTAKVIRENGHIKQIVTITRDITKRKIQREELTHMAFYDHLTGLPNRRLFEDRLELAINQANQSSKMVAFMMIDANGFKQVNDTFGHEAGDVVIKELANRLNSCVRNNDTVSRLGGDEMGIIIPGIESEETAIHVANRIIDAMKPPVFYRGTNINLSVGIGISVFPKHTANKRKLIRFADEALYEAKKSANSNYMVYDSKSTE